jgi:hypothetical protein
MTARYLSIYVVRAEFGWDVMTRVTTFPEGTSRVSLMASMPLPLTDADRRDLGDLVSRFRTGPDNSPLSRRPARPLSVGDPLQGAQTGRVIRTRSPRAPKGTP